MIFKKKKLWLIDLILIDIDIYVRDKEILFFKKQYVRFYFI